MTLCKMLIFSLILISLFFTQIIGENGALLNLEFLCYKNSENLNIKGTSCQCIPILTICVTDLDHIYRLSKERCPILFQVLHTFTRTSMICNKPIDNRKNLSNVFLNELPFPLKNTYYILIYVEDKHSSLGYSNIANFKFVIKNATYPYISDVLDHRQEVFMKRNDFEPKNTNISIKIAVSIVCLENTHNCSEHCMSNQNFRCLDNIKVYRKNSCDPNPCANEGSCIPQQNAMNKFTCSCKHNYTGLLCEEIKKSCLLSSCKNNGTCILQQNNRRICECQPPFYGEECVYKGSLQIKNSTKILIIGFTVTVCVVTLVSAISYMIFKRCKRKIGKENIYIRQNNGEVKLNAHIFKTLHGKIKIPKENQMERVKSYCIYDTDSGSSEE